MDNVTAQSVTAQRVYVVGGQHLQNALLTEFLDKAAIPAIALKSVDQVNEADVGAVEQNLFLVDFHSVDVNQVITRLIDVDRRIENEILIGVFNVDHDDDLSRLAGLPMVNGGFQHDCPQDLLTKGIKAMFKGELWFPRKVLQQYLVKSRAFNKTFSRNEVNLTDREIEVLKVMATGAKNSEIAKVLNLSPHTIKTHIYNIFKKINASNRLQAVNWAQENL
ncbi:LuxR C-terminal-related transcriptional regulator [Alloalcanivorax gelatiniphagus]|uniref:LuxR C-terminal-related transcriptional regulator n=1 Tax=Alloalcanivorax gelatiniphagus TaxID=1194167 RepID=UPI001F0D040A|nr:LuxR C-terminal-related transcriptional regulator [Alloalcanivorax gelatiniphagus]|tara:strand:- start:11350 stop:12012 length:663 start_codon:yes stop_codon:yes gene_type:complete